jgi:hypothetical protein
MIELGHMNLVRVFAVAYTGMLLVQQLRFFGDQRRFIALQPAAPRAAQILGVGFAKVGPAAAMRFGAILVVALACALGANLLGLDALCRVAYGVAFVALAAYYPFIADLGYVIRKILVAPVVFIVLACAPGLTDAWSSPSPTWPLLLLQCYLALVYVSTGIEKVVKSGRLWWRGDVLRGYLVSHHLWGNMPLGMAVANRRWLCRAMSIPTLAWELAFPLVLVLHPSVALGFVAYGIAFHIGTAVLMRIDFHRYWFMNYLVFLPQLALVLS